MHPGQGGNPETPNEEKSDAHVPCSADTPFDGGHAEREWPSSKSKVHYTPFGRLTNKTYRAGGNHADRTALV